jgi:hypothetical protein
MYYNEQYNEYEIQSMMGIYEHVIYSTSNSKYLQFTKIKVSYVYETQFYTYEENSKESETNPANLTL